MLRIIADYYSSQYYSKHDRYFVATLIQTVVTIFLQLWLKPVLIIRNTKKKQRFAQCNDGPTL